MEFFGSLLVDHEKNYFLINKFVYSNGMSSQMTVPVLMGKGAIEVDSSFSS